MKYLTLIAFVLLAGCGKEEPLLHPDQEAYYKLQINSNGTKFRVVNVYGSLIEEFDTLDEALKEIRWYVNFFQEKPDEGWRDVPFVLTKQPDIITRSSTTIADPSGITFGGWTCSSNSRPSRVEYRNEIHAQGSDTTDTISSEAFMWFIFISLGIIAWFLITDFINQMNQL